MTRAIEGVTGAGSESFLSVVFPNAKHGLCVWHLLDRNLKNGKEFKALLAAAKEKSIFARADIDAILRWLWYFARHYETHEEIQFASSLLQKYLTESQERHFACHNKDFRRKLKEFITTKYLENAHKYFDAYFPGMTLGLVTTSNNESYHRATKKALDGPKPCDGIDEARERIDGLEKRRNTIKKHKAAFDQTATMGKDSDRKMRVKQFSDYCNKELIGQHAHGKKHFRFRAEEFVFYVKRDYSDGFCADASDLKELSIYCENYLENIKELQVGVNSLEKRFCVKSRTSTLEQVMAVCQSTKKYFSMLHCTSYQDISELVL